MTGDNGDPEFSERPNEVDWQRAHAELRRLARTHARLESEEGHWLLCALRTRAHVELGYGSFTEYVERLFGYDVRLVREKLRVAEALEHLPELRRALQGGELCWSAVRELTRVATAQTEAEWLEAARGKTSRELERHVSGRKPGDRPGDRAQASTRRHVLRFEVSAETLATVREAIWKLGRQSGGPLDDDAALLLMARQVLGGPTDEGRASYQVLLGVCERCGRAEQQSCGQPVEVGPEVVDMARCDSQQIRAAEGGREGDAAGEARAETHVGHGQETELGPAHIHVGHGSATRARLDADARTRRERGSATRARLDADARTRRERGSATRARLDADARAPRERGSATRARLDADARTRRERGSATRARLDADARTRRERDVRAPARKSLPHAAQQVPPATRRYVVRRDRGCCVVPGCGHVVFVDVHHLSPRSEGGGHDPDGLVVLCAAHHRAVHCGQLVIEGRVSTGLEFQHADGRAYGGPVCAAAAEAWAKAFGALRTMGFSETQTRRALERTRSGVDDSDQPPRVEQVLRRALTVLTEGYTGVGRHASAHAQVS